MSTELGYPYNVLSSVFGERVESKADNAKQLSGLIEKLIEPLPTELKRIFMLYTKEGKTNEEIAKDEELPIEVVTDRIALVLRHLRHPNQSKQLKKIF
ncbi:MAG: hypothetical protein J1E41_08215 [Ruminococcus sp.]|nr:hypothetical protein [Ruminococcus sp.]